MDNSNQTATNNATQAATSGEQAERKFTQAEVDRIVSDRLARAKEQYTQPKESEREIQLKEREAAVAAKESRFKCEDYLRKINMSEKHRGEFLDTLDTANFEQFKKIVDVLGSPYIVTTTVEGAHTANPPARTQGTPDFSEVFRPHTR